MRITVAIFALLAMAAGCGEDYTHLPQIAVEFEWPERRAEEISPRLTLANIPANTKQLEIKMFDRDNSHRHGGGIVAYNGTDVIAEGALKDYQGPGPMFGSPRYEITVKALDETGAVIAFGKTMKRYPPIAE